MSAIALDNPLSAEWVTDTVGSDDYLEAMQMFTDRVREQIESVRAEQEQFKFDMTPFTIDDCIPDDKCSRALWERSLSSMPRSTAMSTGILPIS